MAELTWIPITEKLPDEGADVLAWCGWAITSTYVDWDFWTEDGTNRIQMVTHWMPLPEPPT